MARLLVVALVAALPALGGLPVAAEEPPPRLRLVEGTRLMLGDLPPTLAQEEIAEPLVSGLTTSFDFTVELAGLDAMGGATVQVRYELWDEEFLSAVREGDGEESRSTQSSFKELERWWAGLELTVLDLASLGAAASEARPESARVTLDVVPFSLSEQVETRRWFAETVRRAERGRGREGSQPVEESTGSVDRLFDVLIATSIRRRAITSIHWTLEIQQEAPP